MSADTRLSPLGDARGAEASVAEFALGEQLVVWAIRRRLEGAAHLPMVRRGFLLAGPGQQPRDAFAAFEQFYGALSANCRRDLWFHRCGCGGVSADEIAILGLIAAQQAGDPASARGYGQSLVIDAALGRCLRPPASSAGRWPNAASPSRCAGGQPAPAFTDDRRTAARSAAAGGRGRSPG